MTTKTCQKRNAHVVSIKFSDERNLDFSIFRCRWDSVNVRAVLDPIDGKAPLGMGWRPWVKQSWDLALCVLTGTVSLHPQELDYYVNWFDSAAQRANRVRKPIKWKGTKLAFKVTPVWSKQDSESGHQTSCHEQGLPRKAFSRFIDLRSVLQSPLENQSQGVSLLPPTLPKGANKEVNDGVGTAVDTGQENYHQVMRNEGIEIFLKPH